jgi:hypothetical protein
MMAQLQLGRVPADTSGRSERFFFGLLLEPAWREFRGPILAAWAAARPGSRPWAWWRWDATEPRRCLVGASLLWAQDVEWQWRQSFGVREFRRVPTLEDSRMVVECEAAYLKRLQLLTRQERQALAPWSFQPIPLPLAP